MICQRCGTDAKASDFCPSCGAPTQPLQAGPQSDLSSPPPTQKQKKKFGCLKIGLICAAAAIVTLVLLVTLDGGRSGSENSLSEVALEERLQQIKDSATVDSPESMVQYVKSLAETVGLDVSDVVAIQEGENTYNVFVKRKGSNTITTTLARVGALTSAEDVFKLLQNNDYVASVGVDVSLPLTDQYGNESEGNVLSVILSKEALDRINFDNFNIENLGDIAEHYYLHPDLVAK